MAVSLTSIAFSFTSTQLWSVKGGNDQVPKNMIENSKAKVQLETKVVGILKEMNMKDGKAKYRLQAAKTTLPELYDVIIVTLSLEVPSNYMSCDNCTHWPDKKQIGSL